VVNRGSNVVFPFQREQRYAVAKGGQVFYTLSSIGNFAAVPRIGT
jgi:hypothetical protein